MKKATEDLCKDLWDTRDETKEKKTIGGTKEKERRFSRLERDLELSDDSDSDEEDDFLRFQKLNFENEIVLLEYNERQEEEGGAEKARH